MRITDARNLFPSIRLRLGRNWDARLSPVQLLSLLWR